MSEFWKMSPAEIYLSIDAAITRSRREMLEGSWWTAALVRSKRMPKLGNLLKVRPAKRLEGEELIRRRREFAEGKAGVDGIVLERAALLARSRKDSG